MSKFNPYRAATVVLAVVSLGLTGFIVWFIKGILDGFDKAFGY